MTYRKKTLRQMLPRTRQLARLVNDLDSVQRRLKNYVEIVSDMELDVRAVAAHQAAFKAIREASHQEDQMPIFPHTVSDHDRPAPDQETCDQCGFCLCEQLDGIHATNCSEAGHYVGQDPES